MNEYFAAHPEMMLGEMRMDGRMYGRGEPTLVGHDRPLADQLAEAVARFPTAVFRAETRRTSSQALAQSFPAPEHIKPNAFAVVDELSYAHRFTPRQPRSNWSRTNIQHVERLKKAGRMSPAGLAAYAARQPERSGVYSFENAPRQLTTADEKQFKADKTAWEFFQGQPPGYQRTATWWVVSARKAETHARRLGQLMADSRAGRRPGPASGSKQGNNPA